MRKYLVAAYRLLFSNTKSPIKFTMESAMKRCSERGILLNTVIDVGASDGRWSKLCMDFYPSVKYLLIEAQKQHSENLEKFKLKNLNSDYVIAAAGKEEGEIFFNDSDPLGGQASDKPFDQNVKTVKVALTSIDIEIKKRNLKGPFLIKLDTHGYEVPILEGAVETLKSTNLLIIETYNYKLTKDSLRYWEMNEYLNKLGFLSIEMVDPMLRKHDLSFWQMDTFYIPSDSKEFEYTSFL